VTDLGPVATASPWDRGHDTLPVNDCHAAATNHQRDGQRVSSSGSFTTYTVSVAAYDLFPDFAVQPGQATLLTNPGSILVYVDSNTQQLNSDPLAVGSVLRFNGLVFNDNGILRMDCAQINDGVPE
jgi:hypothetical protein